MASNGAQVLASERYASWAAVTAQASLKDVGLPAHEEDWFTIVCPIIQIPHAGGRLKIAASRSPLEASTTEVVP